MEKSSLKNNEHNRDKKRYMAPVNSQTLISDLLPHVRVLCIQTRQMSFTTLQFHSLNLLSYLPIYRTNEPSKVFLRNRRAFWYSIIPRASVNHCEISKDQKVYTPSTFDFHHSLENFGLDSKP